NALAYLREQQMVSVNPSQPGGVGQKQPRLSSQHRYYEGVPGHAVGDGGAVGSEARAHLDLVVMGELDGLAVRQEADIDLPRGGKGLWPADESQHAPVRREGRRADGVREIGEL